MGESLFATAALKINDSRELYLCPPRASIDDICEILQWILLVTGLNNYAKFSKKSKKSLQRGEKATTTA